MSWNRLGACGHLQVMTRLRAVSGPGYRDDQPPRDGVLGPELTDSQLWELSKTDPDAFGMVFERHAQRVFGYCARRTASVSQAEDLTSVVFLHAWVTRNRVRLVDDSALPWLLGVAANVLRNSARALRRYDAAVARLPASAPVEDPAEGVAERVDAECRLAEALAAMPTLRPAEREVAQLVWWSGLSYAEAAVTLDIPVGTVRSRLSRARARIQHLDPQASPSLAAPPTDVREHP
jgi:RNA polymerase sigma factor (sigma-70 family)